VDRANVDRIVSCKSSSSPRLPLSNLLLALTLPCSHTLSPSLPLGLELISVLLSLIQPSGEVSGDTFSETDSRFTYILLNSLSLLGRLDDLDKPDLYDGKGREMLIENLRGCMNFDGGFGSTPGGESHGGQSGSFFFLVSFLNLVLSTNSSFFPFPLLIPWKDYDVHITRWTRLEHLIYLKSAIPIHSTSQPLSTLISPRSPRLASLQDTS
jgi:hypothetical protein